ncbi:unnamed protein product [Angiostrongylus costaricensis]|uniref:EF-hand domain-containing protein n=1 Tax=Angiostrongylus costaricensis TaxID=334426 RepID=A0A158PF35_ANGCS|nr:unnamed protein product [Angiostrongylus costaricensis]
MRNVMGEQQKFICIAIELYKTLNLDAVYRRVGNWRTSFESGESVPEMISRKLSLYAEFSEFSRKQIKFFTETFKKYDDDADGFIDFDELKRMMEKLGEAQTHIALKEIIRKVDEDQDGKISLREFFLIFRLAAQNQLGCSEVSFWKL